MNLCETISTYNILCNSSPVIQVHSIVTCDGTIGILDDSAVDSTLVLAGSADNSAKLWGCETGIELESFATSSAVRTCCFFYSGNLFVQMIYHEDQR